MRSIGLTTVLLQLVCIQTVTANLVTNAGFESGTSGWIGNSCSISTSTSTYRSGSQSGYAYNRANASGSLMQSMLGKMEPNKTYDIFGWMRLEGAASSNINITVLKTDGSGTSYTWVAWTTGYDNQWVELTGYYTLDVNGPLTELAIYFEGPPAGVNYYLDDIEVAEAGGQNLVTNPGFESETSGWIGNVCSISTSSNVYRSGSHSGYAYNRTGTYSSLRQSMLGKMEPGKTYKISAWMKLEGASGSNINVTVVKTDDSGTSYDWVAWATGYDNQWTELRGYYALNVIGTLTQLAIYFEGPAAGVNYYLDDVGVVEVGEEGEWKEQANARIEQIRKRDAQITVVNKLGYPVKGVEVDINQIKRRFAFGSCINYRVLSNPDYAQFFKDHFEWAVMENESKWWPNEPTQGNVDYTIADNIYNWCTSNGILMRGHCIYWEVESVIQQWIKDLAYAPLPAASPLRNAVESRMNSVVNHFKGKFVHWDVDNEMLHGSFYKDRLGDAIRPWMFQEAHAIDPNCKLFVNDYSVIDGDETEAYKTQIQDLVNNGAPVQGIGAQCHFSGTVLPLTVYDRLESLAELGLPIWCTEYDFAAADENSRADGLEKFYRTAFSHSSVEGILMWGFWEDSHWRDNAHIVNSDWTLNEAGRRYEALMSEWTTNDTNTTDSAGDVSFRGFHGTYEVTLTVPGVITQIQTIELEPGQIPAEYTLVLDCMLAASDLNKDCSVDYEDLVIFAGQWLRSGDCSAAPNCADLISDNFVDFQDFSVMGGNWSL